MKTVGRRKKFETFPRHPHATGKHRPIDNGNPDAVGEVDAEGFVTLHHCHVAAVGDYAALVHHDGGKFWISFSAMKARVRKGHYGDVVVLEEYARRNEII